MFYNSVLLYLSLFYCMCCNRDSYILCASKYIIEYISYISGIAFKFE